MTVMNPATARRDFWGDARPTTLATNLLAGATALSVTAGGLATWGPVVHGLFSVVINRGKADEEHLFATAISGDSLTGLIRGQDGTADQAHAPGATVEHGLLASDVSGPNQLLSLPTQKGELLASAGADQWATALPGANGEAVVYDSLQATGIRATKTLAGFTLSLPILVQPTIADFTNAPHDHGDADDGGVLPTAPAGPSAPGDVAAAGTAPTVSRTDHVHGREGYGAPVASAPGAVGATGTSAAVPRADHVHAREPFATAAELAATGFPVAGSAGTSASVARGDHRHEVLGLVLSGLGGTGNARLQGGTIPYSLSAAASTTVSVTYPVPYINPPMVTAMVETSGARLDVNLISRTNAFATFRVIHHDNTASTTSGDVVWIALGN